MIAGDYSQNTTQIEVEASGRAYVELDGAGDSVTWTLGDVDENCSAQGCEGVTLRFTLPDGSTGLGQTSQVDIYVDGTFNQTLTLDSK
jgi:hypothetical protein